MRFLLVFFLLSGLVSCGAPGAPQPPSLNIPRAVTDLRAVRKGTTVTLSWKDPEKTTDGALFRHSGTMIVRRAVGLERGSIVKEVSLEPAQRSKSHRSSTRVSAARKQFVTDSLDELLRAGGGDFALYTVEAQNGSGKGAGQSNQASVPLVSISAAPNDLEVKAVPRGVSISWNPSWPAVNRTNLAVDYVYRVMRRLSVAGQEPVLVKEVNAGNGRAIVVDSGMEWEKSYEYWVTPVTLWRRDEQQQGEVEGEDSTIVTLTPHDVFPPAVPAGLQAVLSQVGDKSFIDLSWIPVADADVAGYNIFRRAGGAEPAKINRELVKMPGFQDDDVHPGMKYLYSVSAVDVRGNESARSAEASESVPQQ